MDMYGYIAHHTHGFWFKGPLPSPDAARRLVHLVESTGTIPKGQWELHSGPPEPNKVKWVIDLEAPLPSKMAEKIKVALDVLSALDGITVRHDVGPGYVSSGGKDAAPKWVGAELVE
jgi:hypothetical protein